MSEECGQCPSHKGDTAGSDSYFWNTDKEQGKCQSCGLSTWKYKGTLWGKHEGGKTFSVETGLPANDRDEENDFVSDYTPKNITTGQYVPWRGITKETMEHFGVITSDDEVIFPYPNGSTKTRSKSEKIFSGVGKKNELFGMNLFPAGCAKKVMITEGEIDTLSAWQMLQSGKYINPVVSVPGAKPSGEFWNNMYKYLDSFQEIILSVDNDGPGENLAHKISLMFPSKVKVMNHGEYKDANDFLMNGDAQAYKNAWWGAKKYRPDDILLDAQDYLELYDDSPDFEYFETGIEKLDSMMLGICKGYFTVIQAATGVGKSEFMRYLEYQCLTKSNYKFAYMHLEESRIRSVLGLVSYDLNENVILQKFVEDKGLDEEVRESIERMFSQERMVQFSYNSEDGYETLLDKIKYLVAAFDVDYVFFEPIQDLVTGADKEAKLADLASRLGTMASDLDVGIITIAHQNKDGDTMYASMIGKKAAFEIILERDQEGEDLTKKNITDIKIGRKNRVGMGLGPAGQVEFMHDSYTLKPVKGPTEPKANSNEDF